MEGARMRVSVSAYLALGIGAAALAGCAPTVWVRPDTTPEQFSMDRAHCQLMAEGTNPDLGAPTVNTGSFKRDLAANVGLGLVHGLAQGMAVNHTFELCMQANGYSSGGPADVQVAGPPPQVAHSPPPTPAANATAIGAIAAAPLPAREGRVVLFPVTIYNEYRPHWTVDVQ